MENREAIESFWQLALRHAQQWLSHAGDQHVALVGAVVVGVLYCFLGYRLLKVMIAVTGFTLAATSAGLITAWLTQMHTVAVIVAGGIGGITGALFMLFLFRAGIFCLGLLGAALIAHHLLATMDVAWAPWAIVVAGLAGGLMALLVERPVISVATAALGAWILLISGALLLMKSEIAETTAVQELTAKASGTILATWAVLTIAGTAAQFATYRRPEPSEEY